MMRYEIFLHHDIISVWVTHPTGEPIYLWSPCHHSGTPPHLPNLSRSAAICNRTWDHNWKWCDYFYELSFQGLLKNLAKMANKIPYYMGFAFLVVSFILCAIAFGTGYWFVAEGEGRKFVRLGLWEACFNGFEYTSDYIGKAYYGCWWIFHREYSYIREWIMPCKYWHWY